MRQWHHVASILEFSALDAILSQKPDFRMPLIALLSEAKVGNDKITKKGNVNFTVLH